MFGWACCYDIAMAGYSGTPLPQKLGIKPGSRLALVQPPEGFEAMLGPLPGGVVIVPADEEGIDVAVSFVRDSVGVEEAFAALKPRLAWTGGLWIGWPKKQAGQPATLNENTVREIGLAAGLVDNKVCAIDERWSGLRFVWRLEDRPKTAKASRAK